MHAQLIIDPVTAAGLTNLERSERDDWLAMHCPPAPEVARILTVEDVFLEAFVAMTVNGSEQALTEVVLSCRAHDETNIAAREALTTRATRRLNELLGRLR